LGQKNDLDSFRSSSEENGAPQLRAFGNSTEQAKVRGTKLELKSTEDVPKIKGKPLSKPSALVRISQDEPAKVPLSTVLTTSTPPAAPKTPRLKDKSKPELPSTEIQKGSIKIGGGP